MSRLPSDRSRVLARAGPRIHRARASRSRRWLAAPRRGSACRRPRSATSWRGSRSRASSGSRTPRPAGSRPTAATGFYVDLLLEATRVRRASARRRGAAAPRRRRRCSTTCCRTRRTAVARSRTTSASRWRPAPTRPARARSSSSRSAARACSSSSSRRGGQVIAQGRRHRRAARADELRRPPTTSTPSSPACRCTRSARRCSSGCSEERALYDALIARALRLAEPTLDGRCRGEHAMSCEGASSLLDDSARSPEALATLRALLRDDRGEAAAGAAADRVHRRPRADRRHRHRAPRSRPAAVQPGRVDLHDGARIGTVGVIGPTRMRYSRAITAVDSVSHAISACSRLSALIAEPAATRAGSLSDDHD